MTMTDNKWAVVLVILACLNMFLIGTYTKYRVDVLRGDVPWDIPTFNLTPLKKYIE